MQNSNIKKPIFIALGISLPLSIFFSNYLFALAILVLLFSSSKKEKIDWLVLLILLVPALIPILSIFFHNEQFSFTALEVKIPFLVVALIISFRKLDENLLSKFKYGFVLGSLFGAILALLSSTSFVSYLESSSFLDVSYISLYIVISIIYLWFTDIEIKDYIKLIITAVFVFILFSLGDFFFLTAGALIVFAAIIVKGSSLQSKLAIGFLVLLFSIFIYKGSEIQQHLQETGENKELSGVDKLAQWQCVLEVMQNHELFGVGYNSKDALLTTCYHEHAMFKAESNELNSHNEYLDAFLTLGYIGVLGLLIYFFKIMFVAYDSKQVAHLLIIILIALYSITENVFTRQKGVMIASITALLIFSSKKTPETLVEEEPSKE